MNVYESYCKHGAGPASFNRDPWQLTYNNIRVQPGPGPVTVGIRGGVNGNCCIMPMPGFTTRCEEGVSYQLCPYTPVSMYIGPRGGGAGITGMCCKRLPVSSSLAAHYVPDAQFSRGF